MTPIMLNDPLSFLILYFFFSAIPEGIVGIIKISVISSVIFFPFVVLGTRIFEKWKKKRSAFLNFAIISFLMISLFWLISRTWSAVLLGMPFATTGPLEILFMLSLATAISLVFTYTGKKLSEKMKERWEMPKYLHLYLVTLIINCVLWASISSAMYIYSVVP